MTYEKALVTIMKDYDLTMREAMLFDMDAARVDISSVFDICDYLEAQLENLDKVEYYISVFVGQEPDLKLKEIK